MSQTLPPLDLVIVTGAGRGIGRAVACQAARQAGRVLCISRTASCLDTVAAIRRAGGTADALQTDLADYSDSGRAISGWLETRDYRRIGLVLAAGALGPSGPLWETPLDQWDLAWRTNVLGNLAVVKASLPGMRANRFGRLLFFAGGGAAYAYPLFPAYAIAKTALVRAVENLHEDLHGSGDFAVTILAPGAVDTEILATVRAKGAEVSTTVAMEEPVNFVCSFLAASGRGLSGCFVHVRDNSRPFLENGESLPRRDLWKLRRVE
jgi:NAD(P)-dependent dehydrogenase (short-subunit alcohol dehydrogenase family)